MRDSVARQVGGELLKTAKKAAKKAKKTPKDLGQGALDQLLGKETSGQRPTGQSKTKKQQSSKPSPSDQKKLAKLKEADVRESREGIAQTRAGLEREKIRRYQEIQRQQLSEAQKRTGQRLPEYEAGKPGAPGTVEEKKEMIKKQQDQAKQAKKKNQGAQLPSSGTGKMPSLKKLLVRSKKGTREMGKKKLG